MAFTLTKLYAYKMHIDSNVSKRFHQVFELEATRGSADVVVDLFAPTGTFWTSAKSNVTNGDFALNVVTNLGSCVNFLDSIVSIEVHGSAGIMTRVSGAPASASEYQVVNTGTYPVMTPRINLFANATPASFKVVLIMTLKPESYGVIQG